jgi:large subunit ribosomal protein L35
MPSRLGRADDNPPHPPDPMRGIEMPKLKTKSAAKKRFRLTGTGKVRANVAFKQHNLRKRPKKMKRQARGTMILALSDARVAKSCMPYV